MLVPRYISINIVAMTVTLQHCMFAAASAPLCPCVIRAPALTDAVANPTGTDFGVAAGQMIFVDNIACTGSEDRILDCHYDDHTADCTHAEDATLRCTETREITILKLKFFVEVFHLEYNIVITYVELTFAIFNTTVSTT